MFIAKQGNKIVLARATEAELLEDIQWIDYDTIEETNIQYELVNGIYLTPEEKTIFINNKRKEEIKELLNSIDMKSQRSTRAILTGKGTEADETFLANLEAEAEALREELKELS